MLYKTGVWLLVGAVSSAALGCSTGPRRLPVSGTVKFQGQPIGYGKIEFFSIGAPQAGPAAGAMIRDGSFTIPPTQGLEEGNYKVLISSTEEVKELPAGWLPGASLPTKELLPAKYSSYGALTHVVEVKAADRNVFAFDIHE